MGKENDAFEKWIWGQGGRCTASGKNQGKIVTCKLMKIVGKAKSDFRGSVVNEREGKRNERKKAIFEGLLSE